MHIASEWSDVPGRLRIEVPGWILVVQGYSGIGAPDPVHLSEGLGYQVRVSKTGPRGRCHQGSCGIAVLGQV